MSKWLRRWRHDIGMARAGYSILGVYREGCWTCWVAVIIRVWVLDTFFYVPRG